MQPAISRRRPAWLAADESTLDRPRSGRSQATRAVSWIILVALACSACGGLARAVRRSGYDYEWERTKCNTLRDDGERGVCLKDLQTAKEQAINPNGYITAQADARKEAEKDLERQAILSRCNTAADAARREVARGNFRGGLKISKESDICPNALAIEAAVVKELRTWPSSEIARYGDESVILAYWQPMDFAYWAHYASKGNFVTNQGVWIVGTIEQQIDNMVIVNIMESGPRCAVRFDRSRYFLEGGGIQILGRFVKMEQFDHAFGVRRDLPVFEYAY